MNREGQSLLLVNNFCHANNEGNHACEVEGKYPLLTLLRQRNSRTMCSIQSKGGAVQFSAM